MDGDLNPKPLSPGKLHKVVHELYIKAGLFTRKPLGRRYDLRGHSIRKFFRRQMAALGVDRDYTECVMGHVISTYHNIQMKDMEFLRGICIASGISIKPKTRVSKSDALKEIIGGWGPNPEDIPNWTEPHPSLTTALKQQVLEGICETQSQKSIIRG